MILYKKENRFLQLVDRQIIQLMIIHFLHNIVVCNGTITNYNGNLRKLLKHQKWKLFIFKNINRSYNVLYFHSWIVIWACRNVLFIHSFKICGIVVWACSNVLYFHSWIVIWACIVSIVVWACSNLFIVSKSAGL